MSFEYLVFLSFICIVSIISFIAFWIIAMKTDDEYGIGIWGAMFSFCAVMMSSVTICIIIISSYLKIH